MSNASKAEAVLAEVLEAAIESGREARARYEKDEAELPAVMAYYDIITFAQLQAKLIGLKFVNRAIDAFDAERELLGKRKGARRRTTMRAARVTR